LIRLLEDPDPSLRRSVAEILGSIRPAGTGAVTALTQALDDFDFSVRNQAVRSLAKIGPAAKAAIPALTQALWDAGWGKVDAGWGKDLVIYSLAKIGPEAATALSQSLRHPSAVVRNGA